MASIRVVYARQKAREEVILRFCPEAPTESGIYVFYRDDASELKFCYVGQAVNLLKRMAEHLGEYDHIGLSLKKRGFYREDNPFGWKIVFKPCPKENLDENEKLTIKSFAEKGYQLYNHQKNIERASDVARKRLQRNCQKLLINTLKLR